MTIRRPRRTSPIELASGLVGLGLLVNEALRTGPGRYLIVGAALALLGVIPANWGDEILNRRRRGQNDDDG